MSPDGTRLAFVRLTTDKSSEACIAGTDGTGERRLLTRKLPDRFLTIAWSPDGRSLATLVFEPGPRSDQTGRIHLIDPETGDARELDALPISGALVDLEWLREGFLLTGSEPSTGDEEASSQVWFFSHPGGQAHRITHDLSSYGGLSVTSDGRAVVAGQYSVRANIWILSEDDGHGWRQVTSGKSGEDGLTGLDWTPGSHVLFESVTSGSRQLWSIASDGSGARQLTFGQGDIGELAVSPDGRVIAFNSGRSGQWENWRMDSDGANLRQLTYRGTAAGTVQSPHFTPDGAWIVYSRGYGSDATCWKVAVNGGEPVRLFANAAESKGGGGSVLPPGFTMRALSPDGRWAAGTRRAAAAPGDRGFALVSMDGTRPWRELTLPAAAGSPMRWTRDGRSLAHVRTEGGVSNIWLQPLDGGAPRQLTSFADQEIFSFAWSRDGRTLAVSRGNVSTDVVMITSEDKK